MQQTKTFRPVNSLLFISDPDGGEPPAPKRGARLLSTSSCISVGCYPEQDGPTVIVLGQMQDVDSGARPIFDGELETPNRAVLVSTAAHEKILETKVPDIKTKVRIWTNHPRWPDKVIVGLDS